MQDLQTSESQPLFPMRQLCRGFRPSLSIRGELHRYSSVLSAKRNYLYFNMFICMSFVSIIFFSVQAVIYFIYLFIDKSTTTPVVIIIIVCIFGIPIGLVGIALLGFGIFHLVLQIRYVLVIMRGKTTREFIKKIDGRQSKQNSINQINESNGFFTRTKPHISYNREMSSTDIERITTSTGVKQDNKNNGDNNNNQHVELQQA